MGGGVAWLSLEGAAVAAFRIPDQSKTYARYGFRSRIKDWAGGFGQQILGMTWIAHHGKHGSESTLSPQEFLPLSDILESDYRLLAVGIHR